MIATKESQATLFICILALLPGCLDEGRPIATSAELITTKSGIDYIQECVAAGVPIPDLVFDGSWVNRGLLQYSLVANQSGPPLVESELWSWESSDPPGVCLALPRWLETDEAESLGIICFGTGTGHACFFDNPSDVEHPRGTVLSMTDDFIGGLDLGSNGQGECSDCHAGANPFIVHPDMSAFAGLMPLDMESPLRSHRWHEPIIPEYTETEPPTPPILWPDNPGPMAALPFPGPGQVSCAACHTMGNAGPFPHLPSVPGYCNKVLLRAIHGPPSEGAPTMPPSGFTGDFSDDIVYLEDVCSGEIDVGVDTGASGPKDDKDFLSPPQVFQMYLCTHFIAVGGTRLDAELELLLDGEPVAGPVVVRNPEETVFNIKGLGYELTEDQEWSARQRIGGGPWSPVSEPVSPIEYPAELLAPAILPATIYRCSESLNVVAHAGGATLDVERSIGTDFEVYGSPLGSSRVLTSTPFDTSEEVRVAQRLCEEMSPWSEVVIVESDPSPMDPPHIPQIFAEQQLIDITGITVGSRHQLSSSVSGAFVYLDSWPTLARENVDVATHLGRPIVFGETIQAEQNWSVCDGSSTVVSQPALGCGELPPARIVGPRAGDTQVVQFGDRVPGSTVRIWASGEEIGDASSNVIQLGRPLVIGEIVQVMRELSSGCRAPMSFTVEVR